MGVIKEAALIRTELGNDPADHRSQDGYLGEIEPVLIEDAWMSDFELTDEEIAELGDPEWIYPNLLLRAHVIVIPAPPNGGKTTIMMWVAGEIARDNQVVYVNADIAGSDVKEMIRYAKDKGFRLLVPDMKVGGSMTGVVEHLRRINKKGTDCSNKVFIFDTLKKMTDVINKSQAKELMSLFRGLSAKGATVVLLAHTNKHKGVDGKNIFEGVGDIKSDVDEMIYLEHQSNPDGSMTVTTLPDKVRNKFEPTTFIISSDRKVSTSEYIDIRALNRDREQRKKDKDVIDAIQEAIHHDQHTNGAIAGYCHTNFGFSKKRASDVLRRYDRTLWTGNKEARNAWHYTLESAPLQNWKTSKTEISPAEF